MTLEPDRRWLVIGAALALLAVLAGTFGAHGLDGNVSEKLLASFETGVRYHLIHAVAIVALASVAGMRVARVLFVIGIALFAGSLYGLALRSFGDVPNAESAVVVTKKAPLWLVLMTPVGGGFLMAGWVGVIVAAAKRPQR